MTRGLVIGRFQPLCKHHVQLLETILEDVDELLIGVGQPNYDLAKQKLTSTDFELYKRNYIFDFETVSRWLNQALDQDKIAVSPVYDVFDTEHFGRKVEQQFNERGYSFENITLYSENPRTLASFHIPKKHVEQIGDVHASDVRKQIMETGTSEFLAVDLSSRELEKIVSNEKLRSWVKQGAKVAYDGHVKLIQQPYDGIHYDVVVSKDACAMMYIDEADDVYFVEQYRVPMGKDILELPAECLDKPGKSPKDHAVMGLHEELGIKVHPQQVQHIATVGSSEGHDTEMVHLYLAKGPHEYVGQQLDEHEYIQVRKIPFDTAYEMYQSGELQGSKTAILLQHEKIRRLEATYRG